MAKNIILENDPDKKYYIFDTFFNVTPVDNYIFSKKETHLKHLIEDERFSSKRKQGIKNNEIKKIINQMGFEWDPLSEPGQMRQVEYATTIMEAGMKYSWSTVEQFGEKQNLPIHKIDGGELFNSDYPELKKQIASVYKTSTQYGENYYNVSIGKTKQILRYSSCTQKFSVAKEINLSKNALPIGLFEISKSYRFENENELQLCNRTRSFHLPELHLLTDSFDSAKKISLSVHTTILELIKKFDTNYELQCNITNVFLKENIDFLKSIGETIHKPFLLVVYDNNDPYCKDGVIIDIEYKVFDVSGLPIEISTFQIDDGKTNSSFNIKYKSNKHLKPVSTIHVVFNASIERFIYFLLNRAIGQKKETGCIKLPFWVCPIHVRIIIQNKNSINRAKELANKLNLLNFRTDIDDRKINYNSKIKDNDLDWIPYIITFNKEKTIDNLVVNNRGKRIYNKTMSENNLIIEMQKEKDRNIIVPRYTPILLSKKLRRNKLS